MNHCGNQITSIILSKKAKCVSNLPSRMYSYYTSLNVILIEKKIKIKRHDL